MSALPFTETGSQKNVQFVHFMFGGRGLGLARKGWEDCLRTTYASQ